MYAAAGPPDLYDDDFERYGHDDENMDSDVESHCRGSKHRKLINAAGLDGKDFESSLDDEEQKVFDDIFQEWDESSKTPELLSRIAKVLSGSGNPFRLALKYFANANQFPKEDSLAFAALEALDNLKKELDKEFVAKCLDDDTKYVSFSFASDKNLTTMKLVAETYELVKSNHLFIDDIRSLVFRWKFKEAGQLAVVLELCNYFPIEDILIPLFLEDKQQIFDDYFAKADQLRLQMIKFLDSLMEPPHDTVFEKCQMGISKYYLKDVNKDKFTSKSIQKLIRRLSKLHKIDKSKTPFCQRYTEEKELSFIIKYHYEAKKSSRETFLDNVNDFLKAKKMDLKLQLIQQCLDCGKHDDAQMFIHHFKIPEHLVPKQMQRLIDQGIEPKKPKISEKRSTGVNDGWSDDDGPVQEQEFYKLRLIDSQIVVVDTVDSYLKMFDRLKATKIAFDTEFTNNNTAAILQLAVPDFCFIVDILTLQNLNMKRSLWQKLADEVFNNDSIIKIAFSFSSDLEVLRKIAGLEIHEPKSSYRDLKTLSEKAFEKPDLSFPFPVKNINRANLSLSKLVMLCFGKELNKGDRLSNWSRRPLRPYQIKYAALDAFVLLEIYEILPEIM